jgi:hypothetical protein
VLVTDCAADTVGNPAASASARASELDNLINCT